ncbi:hypothetical protein ACERK3_04490 [Phycisphaerales bacterium AB-hyl4]|uniref:Uncharacterized protein n=1 Tax=Natronomicrosphaera hydrolytica TaxID=3242702 RepID=A0ABV4U4Y5_9BACT
MASRNEPATIIRRKYENQRQLGRALLPRRQLARENAGTQRRGDTTIRSIGLLGDHVCHNCFMPEPGNTPSNNL